MMRMLLRTIGMSMPAHPGIQEKEDNDPGAVLLSATHLFSLLVGFFLLFCSISESIFIFLIPVYLQLILKANIQGPSSVERLSPGAALHMFFCTIGRRSSP